MQNKDNIKIEDQVSVKLKRGFETWSLFPIAYNILLTITIGLITVVPASLLEWKLKIILIVLFSAFYLDICFYNDWFRNRVVCFFTKSLEHLESRHSK